MMVNELLMGSSLNLTSLWCIGRNVLDRFVSLQYHRLERLIPRAYEKKYGFGHIALTHLC